MRFNIGVVFIVVILLFYSSTSPNIESFEQFSPVYPSFITSTKTRMRRSIPN